MNLAGGIFSGQLCYFMSHSFKLLQLIFTLSIERRVHFGGEKSLGLGICPNCGKEIKWLGFGLASLFFPQVHVDQAEPRGIANQFDGAV